MFSRLRQLDNTYSNSDLKIEVMNEAIQRHVIDHDVPKITTLFAAVRFRPVPPANVDMRKTNFSGSWLNRSISPIPVRIHIVRSDNGVVHLNILSPGFVDPSKRQNGWSTQ